MWIFFALTILFILITNSTVRIEINEKLIDSYEKLKNLKYRISLELFNKINVISFKITKDKIIGKDNKIIKGGYIDLKKILKYIFNKEKIKIEKLKLDLKLGTEDAALTSYIVVIISTIISTLIAKKVDKFSYNKYKYGIIPLYENKNIIKLSINCIISIKLVHIIYMIYVLKRKDDEKYGRTSNRRTYDNGNEQYKRYGRCRYNYR